MATDDRPLHQALLDNPTYLLSRYDQTAQSFIDEIRLVCGFDKTESANWQWSESQLPLRNMALETLTSRAHMIDTLYRHLPNIRNVQLAEAHAPLQRSLPQYHESTRLYAALKRQFIERNCGNEKRFLRLYQAMYLQALAQQAPLMLEASAPADKPQSQLHAQVIAASLPPPSFDDDPIWAASFSHTLTPTGETGSGTLRDLLGTIAHRTVAVLMAGTQLANCYHATTNLGWFGTSIWKVLTDAELAILQLDQTRLPPDKLKALEDNLLRLKAMLIEFVQAHREEPWTLRPDAYWYGQPYSYLTRDLIDLGAQIIRRLNRVIRTAGVPIPPLTRPPLWTGDAQGRFLEYAHVGKTADISPLKRLWRYLRWIKVSWSLGRKRKQLLEAQLPPNPRYAKAWTLWREWSMVTMRCFGIQVHITIDPLFQTIARELELHQDAHPILFLPTHQSLVEHLITFTVFQSPTFLQAMGWETSRPFVTLVRQGLARQTGLKIGAWERSLFGVSPDVYDEMLETLDGYILRERPTGTPHAVASILQAMSERPGLIYPMGTTASFSAQLFPLQRGLFAQLPPNVVIIPVAFRGSHALWPRCPKGNRQINPGVIEAVLLPPMMGETTLMPKRGALRMQNDVAALCYALHIHALLNPECASAGASDTMTSSR